MDSQAGVLDSFSLCAVGTLLNDGTRSVAEEPQNSIPKATANHLRHRNVPVRNNAVTEVQNAGSQE